VETVFPGYVAGACLAAPQAFADVLGVASLSVSCAAGLLDAFAESWVAAPVGGGADPAFNPAAGRAIIRYFGLPGCALAPAEATFSSVEVGVDTCMREGTTSWSISCATNLWQFFNNGLCAANDQTVSTPIVDGVCVASDAAAWGCVLSFWIHFARACFTPNPHSTPPHPVHSAGSWAVHCGSVQPEPPPPSPPAPPPIPALTASLPPSALPTGNANIPLPSSPSFTGTRATSGSPAPLAEGGGETPSPPASSGASRSSSLGAVFAVFALFLCGAAL
jgi:hypothetical protein